MVKFGRGSTGWRLFIGNANQRPARWCSHEFCSPSTPRPRRSKRSVVGTKPVPSGTFINQERPDSRVRPEKNFKKCLRVSRRLWELYECRSGRLRGRFRKDLCAFSRRLVLADPQERIWVAELIRGH